MKITVLTPNIDLIEKILYQVVCTYVSGRVGVPHETRGSRFSTIIGFILCRGLELLYIAACLSVYWGATFMGLLFNFISSHDGAISIDCTIRLPAFSLLKLSGFYCQDCNNIDYVLIIYL